MGNICRSPTAEAVLRHVISQNNLSIEVDSAGTEDYHIGNPPDPRSIRHAEKRGYDLRSLRARQVRAADFQEFDLILAADSNNLSALRRRCPAALQHKLALFLDSEPLPDPYYGEADGFERVLDLVEERSVRLVQEWTRGSN
jgi:protein-tyrosine phosphatase